MFDVTRYLPWKLASVLWGGALDIKVPDPHPSIRTMTVPPLLPFDRRIEDILQREARERRSIEEERNEALLRKQLRIPDDAAEDVESLANLGVSKDKIALLTKDPRYGPRECLSDARRLLRAIRFKLLDPSRL